MPDIGMLVEIAAFYDKTLFFTAIQENSGTENEEVGLEFHRIASCLCCFFCVNVLNFFIERITLYHVRFVTVLLILQTRFCQLKPKKSLTTDI